MAAARARFRSLAWGTLAYTVLVILFGAVVRITGSGAGCGQHWPTCHGEVVPISPTIETVIEFSHRVTSGLCGIIVLALLVAALRGFPRGHAARLGAWLALVFTITEALIGAGLVRFGLVGDNDSVARAIVMAAHLLNTSLLSGALALAAWAAGRDEASEPARPGPSRRVRWLREVVGEAQAHDAAADHGDVDVGRQRGVGAAHRCGHGEGSSGVSGPVAPAASAAGATGPDTPEDPSP